MPRIKVALNRRKDQQDNRKRGANEVEDRDNTKKRRQD
jgi:hypothetical protein